MDWIIENDRPIWLQLYEQLTLRIVTGVYSMGEKMPTVRELAAEAGVNPNTMQRALTELEREGLLVGGGTSGRTVTTNQEILSAMRDRILAELARECAEKFLTFGITPTQAAQLLLNLEGEQEVL